LFSYTFHFQFSSVNGFEVFSFEKLGKPHVISPEPHSPPCQAKQQNPLGSAQGRPDHTSGGAAAPPVKGWVHPPRKGCPPQKKEKEVKRGKKKKGRPKERTQEKRRTIKDRGLRCRGSSL